MIFPKNLTTDFLDHLGKGTMVEFLDIRFEEIGEDYLKASMPVSPKTIQPMGLLHGGANVVLAESLGSIAAYLCVDNDKYACVGLEINANHVRAVRQGKVMGICRPIHIGKSTHIWEIKIYNEEEKLSCVSRITVAVLEKK